MPGPIIYFAVGTIWAYRAYVLFVTVFEYLEEECRQRNLLFEYCDYCDYLWFIFVNWTTLRVKRGAPIERRNIQGKQTNKRWRPKYQKSLKLAYNSFIRVVILVSTAMFWGSRDPIWPKQILLSNEISCKSKMAAKMTVKLLLTAIIRLLFTPELQFWCLNPCFGGQGTKFDQNKS